MSRLGALAEHVRRISQEILATNPDATVVELMARLAEHAEDAVALENEQMHREDASRGVGV